MAGFFRSAMTGMIRLNWSILLLEKSAISHSLPCNKTKIRSSLPCHVNMSSAMILTTILGGLLSVMPKPCSYITTNLYFSLEFVEFFEHILRCALHAVHLQGSKLTLLPDVPVGMPVLCDLPDLLQVVYVLYKAYRLKQMYKLSRFASL